MSEGVLDHPTDRPLIALLGIPNCGKTALFNALTGGRQKIGNYPGVTVERKEGLTRSPSRGWLRILDLPGTYSLDARTPDEMITRDVILGRQVSESPPEMIIAVVDAANLERNLGLVLEVRALGIPVVLALNMVDLAEKRGLRLDLAVLSRELRIPVVPTVAIHKKGITEVIRQVEEKLSGKKRAVSSTIASASSFDEIRDRFKEVDRILDLAVQEPLGPTPWTDRIDRWVLHPVWGSLLFVFVLAVMFQAIFSLASAPMDWIREGLAALGTWIGSQMDEGPLRSLLVDGIVSGVGSVLVFLPQILLLFSLILILEDSGYMARAAFLMDRMMGRVGLHGKAFIPLLSSYACAIPGIMAARTIESRRDRLVTILIAPLTTCSARLPVYALLIGAFIPSRSVLGPLTLQGLVMFGLYFIGIGAALAVAAILNRSVLSGAKESPVIFELPTYKWPSLRNMMMGLFDRSRLFVRRAGTVILTLSILLWFLASYPKAPEGVHSASKEPAISYSFAGKIGHAIEPLVRPLGFNWQIAVALIPGFAAREVMVGALATVYAVETTEESTAELLGPKISKEWSLATALSLLVWYVLACQCLSTLAVTRRETNSWRWPAFMMLYMTALAYGGSFFTYQLAKWIGWG